MTTNEIKKILYRNKLIANHVAYDTNYRYYLTSFEGQDIKFKVPFDDMGPTLFGETEPAQLLIRWLIQ